MLLLIGYSVTYFMYAPSYLLRTPCLVKNILRFDILTYCIATAMDGRGAENTGINIQV